MPYRGIGVNYYDAFVRTLRNPQDNSYRAGFRKLGDNNIPFARFAAGGYTANDLQLYLTDKEAYFRLLDDVVHSAEKSNVGLIASLFWSIAAVSDAVNEPRERWGDANSKTRQFMRSYTRDVVSRYADSPPSGVGSLVASSPCRSTCQISRVVSAEVRSARHVFTRCSKAQRWISLSVVRSIDPNRILLTGQFSAPRVGLSKRGRARCEPDTEQQFASILLRDNPGPYNPICIHAAPAATTALFWRPESLLRGTAASLCEYRPLGGQSAVYVEEFVPGARPRLPAVARDERAGVFFQRTSGDQIERSTARFGLGLRSQTSPDRSNLTFDNERSYMLQMIAAPNRN